MNLHLPNTRAAEQDLYIISLSPAQINYGQSVNDRTHSDEKQWCLYIVSSLSNWNKCGFVMLLPWLRNKHNTKTPFKQHSAFQAVLYITFNSTYSCSHIPFQYHCTIFFEFSIFYSGSCVYSIISQSSHDISIVNNGSGFPGCSPGRNRTGGPSQGYEPPSNQTGQQAPGWNPDWT